MSSEIKPLSIAVDFGGVLSIHDKSNTDGKEHRSTSINMKDAMDCLKLLKSQGHKLYLNSFCGKSRAVETKKAINEQIPGLFDGIYFVKDKKFKGLITKMLGCDVMIDDTLDILLEIQKNKTCSNLIWFTGDPSFDDKRTAENITNCDSWQNIIKCISLIKPVGLPDNTIDIKSKIYN
jgi:hypothetical protein